MYLRMDTYMHTRTHTLHPTRAGWRRRPRSPLMRLLHLYLHTRMYMYTHTYIAHVDLIVGPYRTCRLYSWSAMPRMLRAPGGFSQVSDQITLIIDKMDSAKNVLPTFANRFPKDVSDSVKQEVCALCQQSYP